MSKNHFKLTIRVSLWMQIILLVLALPCTIGIISIIKDIVSGSLRISESLVLLLFLTFFAVIGWGNAFSSIQITEKSVTVTVFYGRFRIKWDEVETISERGQLIALIGKGKRVVLSLAFARKSKKEMLKFFSQQVERRNLKYEKNAEPFPINHQNARVWW